MTGREPRWASKGPAHTRAGGGRGRGVGGWEGRWAVGMQSAAATEAGGRGRRSDGRWAVRRQWAVRDSASARAGGWLGWAGRHAPPTAGWQKGQTQQQPGPPGL